MKNSSIIFFFLVTVIHLVAIQAGYPLLAQISKPLMIPALAIVLFISVGARGLSKWIFAALLFSWIGDILLMFDDKAEIYFLLGLSSFLIAHLFYIVFFHRLRIQEGIKSRIWVLGLVAVYYTALIVWLSPYLGDKKLPVRLYGTVISFMLLLALHMIYMKNKKAGNLLVTGAVLFVVSDSVLAINKFYHPFEFAGLIVMVTYALAQYFLVSGAIRYIGSGNTR